MSRSKNSRKGSRKGHWWKRPGCSCFICGPTVFKKTVFAARAIQRDHRNELHAINRSCDCLGCMDAEYGIYEPLEERQEGKPQPLAS